MAIIAAPIVRLIVKAFVINLQAIVFDVRLPNMESAVKVTVRHIAKPHYASSPLVTAVTARKTSTVLSAT